MKQQETTCRSKWFKHPLLVGLICASVSGGIGFYLSEYKNPKIYLVAFKQIELKSEKILQYMLVNWGQSSGEDIRIVLEQGVTANHVELVHGDMKKTEKPDGKTAIEASMLNPKQSCTFYVHVPLSFELKNRALHSYSRKDGEVILSTNHDRMKNVMTKEKLEGGTIGFIAGGVFVILGFFFLEILALIRKKSSEEPDGHNK